MCKNVLEKFKHDYRIYRYSFIEDSTLKTNIKLVCTKCGKRKRVLLKRKFLKEDK